MESDMQNSGGFSFLQMSTTESLLTSSQYAKVIFHNVAEKYDSSSDLVCCFYSLCDDFQVAPGDRIVLFKLGWQHITDYELFEWAPKLERNEKATVVFKAENLPNNTYEFYQFCYVNVDNAISGASVPFQFSVTETESVDTVDSKIILSNDMSLIEIVQEVKEETSKPNENCDKNNSQCTQCTRLKEENDILKSTIENFNVSLKKYDTEILDLRNEIENLKTLLNVTQDDVSEFKLRLKMAGEEFKKLYLEKIHVEKKYDKLIKKCKARKGKKSSQPDYDFLDELEPFPVFPFPTEMKQI